jgi:hypothetical protein
MIQASEVELFRAHPKIMNKLLILGAATYYREVMLDLRGLN